MYDVHMSTTMRCVCTYMGVFTGVCVCWHERKRIESWLLGDITYGLDHILTKWIKLILKNQRIGRNTQMNYQQTATVRDV